MKIILAIDSLKGCLTSPEAEAAAAAGIRSAYPEAQIISLPVSDGGEGMLEAFTAAMGGRIVSASCHDPLMRELTAPYGLSDDGETAIIEMAKASGLTLLTPQERNPLTASSYGTGELMAHALQQGCRQLIVGLGGSATSDAGMGMLQALGADFGGDTLAAFTRINTDKFLPALQPVRVIMASDVRNPLYGPKGAAHVFAPQKGATPEMVELIDQSLERFAKATTNHFGKDCSALPGAGAAGGMGYALLAYMNAEMHPGIDLLLDALHFDEILKDASLVITGEGSADRQTLMGKLPYGIMKRASAANVPTMLIAGQVSDTRELTAAGFAAATSINPAGMPLYECLRPEVAKRNIALTVQRLVRSL